MFRLICDSVRNARPQFKGNLSEPIPAISERKSWFETGGFV